MQTNPSPSTPVKCYWVLDGTSKAYVLREEIKRQGGYFVNDHKAWAINNPSEQAINVLRCSGLIVQFRKFMGGEK